MMWEALPALARIQKKPRDQREVSLPEPPTPNPAKMATGAVIAHTTPTSSKLLRGETSGNGIFAMICT